MVIFHSCVNVYRRVIPQVQSPESPDSKSQKNEASEGAEHFKTYAASSTASRAAGSINIVCCINMTQDISLENNAFYL